MLHFPFSTAHLLCELGVEVIYMYLPVDQFSLYMCVCVCVCVCVSSAFSLTKTHSALDHLFTLFFDSVLSPSTTLPTLTTLTPHLPLPTDLKVNAVW